MKAMTSTQRAAPHALVAAVTTNQSHEQLVAVKRSSALRTRNEATTIHACGERWGARNATASHGSALRMRNGGTGRTVITQKV